MKRATEKIEICVKHGPFYGHRVSSRSSFICRLERDVCLLSEEREFEKAKHYCKFIHLDAWNFYFCCASINL